MANLLGELPRGWWGQELPGYRDQPAFATYFLYEYSGLPPIERELDDDLHWLLVEPSLPGSLAERHPLDPDPIREATSEQLDLLVGSRTLTVPGSFRSFIALDEPRRRVRSCTKCYLDLGDFLVPVSGDASGDGWLVHFLSDQQWVLHWLLYTDAAGREAVLATDAPLGFEPDEGSPRLFVREFDSKVVQAAVCAESFLEFLYRFWIENEIYSALAVPDATLRPLTAEQSRYLAHYRR